jgi:hypothetical protein
MTEESPTRNGLAQIFSKTQSRSKKDRSSGSNSIASIGAESDGRRGVRESLEGIADKLKIHQDPEEEIGLKKLLSQSLGSKRRQKKQEKEEEERQAEEAARGRSIADRGTLENTTVNPISRRDSSNSRDEDGNEGAGGGSMSSLVTSDSDSES